MLLSFALLLFATFASAVLIKPTGGESVLLSFITSLLGYVFYAAVLMVSGFPNRLGQTISSIMACGSILTLLMVFAYVMLSPFLGARIAALAATLILFWSVPVKGHIIARAINKHWYLGIAIAMAIFILQFAIYSAMVSSD